MIPNILKNRLLYLSLCTAGILFLSAPTFYFIFKSNQFSEEITASKQKNEDFIKIKKQLSQKSLSSRVTLTAELEREILAMGCTPHIKWQPSKRTPIEKIFPEGLLKERIRPLSEAPATLTTTCIAKNIMPILVYLKQHPQLNNIQSMTTHLTMYPTYKTTIHSSWRFIEHEHTNAS